LVVLRRSLSFDARISDDPVSDPRVPDADPYRAEKRRAPKFTSEALRELCPYGVLRSFHTRTSVVLLPAPEGARESMYPGCGGR
jgi:hypothetical protein